MPWDEGLVNSLVYDRADPAEGRVVSYVQAVNEALALALEHDPHVFVLGQGVDDPTAMFGTTKGLQARFGRSRVFDTPLSEEGMMGVATGAAMNGMRPVYMHNRPDFILLAMNQLVTHAAKFHFMDNGETKVPMVVWAAIGRGWGSESRIGRVTGKQILSRLKVRRSYSLAGYAEAECSGGAAARRFAAATRSNACWRISSRRRSSSGKLGR